MQQLNFSTISSSQNVEAKDSIAAILPSPLNDGFSQHIESHLAKNKDVIETENRDFDADIAPQQTSSDNSESNQKIIKTESQVDNTQNEVNTFSDEDHLANDTQKVAANGNNSEMMSSETLTDDVNQSARESELLMSFFSKVDKTLTAQGSVEKAPVDKVLVDKNLAENGSIAKNAENTSTFEDNAEIQKVKGEAQLFLKSSDLIADLSGVAKAIKSTSETESADSFEQEKELNVSKVTANDGKENQDIKQLLTKSTIDSNGLANATENSTNNIDEIPVEGSKKTEEKFVELAPNKAINAGVVNTIDAKEASQSGAGLAANKVDDNAVKASSQIVGDVEEAVNPQIQQALEQDNLMSERVNIDANHKANPLKSEDGTQATTVSQSMTKKNANDEVLPENESVSDEQRLTTEQNENVKSEKSILKSTDKPNSVNSNAQQSFTQPVIKDKVQHSGTDSLGEATTESLAKEENLKSSESQLSTKAAENLVENSKEVVGDSKELNPKGMAKTNTDFAFNTNPSDATNRATLATHDRVEHQTIDAINPTSSAEVSQSQKTNTQLHNETISIFRKDFSEAVKDKVMLMISQKLQQFDITLDPPELGNIHVKVNLQGEQATVSFVVQNQQAKEALDQNMHKLRDMLANQGVDVGDANVEQQSQQSNNNEKGDDTNHRSATNIAEASDVLEHTLSARMIESSTRGIDYYA